jgi:EmrB/QacA subfamily drug resistance transporter
VFKSAAFDGHEIRVAQGVGEQRDPDLLGRRVLVTGTVLFAAASFAGGLAGSSGVLIGARLAQGAGAAMMLPAALSILTTTFREGADRVRALGAWGGMAGLGSAAGVLLGGVLTQSSSWRWVFLVKPPLCVLVLAATFWLIGGDRRRAQLGSFYILGAVLSAAGTLLLVYALVRAPAVGWGSARTITELAGAFVLLAAFAANEQRSRNPLLPLSIFRIRGLAAADVTQLIGVAGFIAMFFFLTLYMQDVLGYSPVRTGLAYLPVTAGVGIAAGVIPRLLSRIGTRPIFVAGALIAAGGIYWLAQVPVHGSYLSDVLPGMLIMSVGLGAEFVAATTAANAGVPPEAAGLAAALFNASQQIGGALGLAVFSAIAAARTTHLLAAHAALPDALDAGFHRALLAASIFLLAAAVIALRTTSTRGGPSHAVPEPLPEPAPAVNRGEPQDIRHVPRPGQHDLKARPPSAHLTKEECPRIIPNGPGFHVPRRLSACRAQGPDPPVTWLGPARSCLRAGGRGRQACTTTMSRARIALSTRPMAAATRVIASTARATACWIWSRLVGICSQGGHDLAC